MTTMTKRWIVAGVIIIAIGIAGYFAKDSLFQPTRSIAEVKTDVDTILNQVKLMFGPSLTITYTQPEIEEDGQDFLVTLDNLKITSAEDGQVLIDNAGPKFLLAYEGDNIKITPEIPSNISFETDGVNLSVEKEIVYFVWSTKANTFIGADVSFKNLSAKQDQDEFGIASIKYTADLKETGPGAWSGPTKFIVDGIYLQSPANAFTIKKVDMNAHYKDFNIEEYVKLFTQLAKEAKTPEDQLAMFMRLISDKRFLELFGSVEFALTIKDINVQIFEGQPLDIKLPEFKFAYNFEDLKSDEAKIELEIYSKDTTSAVTSQMGIDPSAFKIQLNLEKVPLKSILADVSNEVQKSSIEEVDYPTIINKHLSQAGTNLNVDSLDVDIGPAHLTTKGRIKADGNAAAGVSGEVDFTIVGIDELISKAGAPAEAKFLAEVVKGLGKKETKNGQDVFVYKLVIDPDGKILLNGIDWSTLMQSLPVPGVQQPGLPMQPGQPDEQLQQPDKQIEQKPDLQEPENKKGLEKKKD